MTREFSSIEGKLFIEIEQSKKKSVVNRQTMVDSAFFPF